MPDPTLPPGRHRARVTLPGAQPITTVVDEAPSGAAAAGSVRPARSRRRFHLPRGHMPTTPPPGTRIELYEHVTEGGVTIGRITSSHTVDAVDDEDSDVITVDVS